MMLTLREFKRRVEIKISKDGNKVIPILPEFVTVQLTAENAEIAEGVKE